MSRQVAWLLFGGCLVVLALEARSAAHAVSDHPVWTGTLPEQAALAEAASGGELVASTDSTSLDGGE